MAKNQNLSLNPTKINGVCGRLLCCLKYEDETYEEIRKELPKIGKIVELKQGKGKVISIDVLARTYDVEIENVGIVKVDLNESNK
jgi:cell fate regulator YaaT (PSP1 superfamily)